VSRCGFLKVALSDYSDLGNQDVLVIQNLVKETAQTQQIDASAKKRFKGKSEDDDGAWAKLSM
jgi:hypothetical protein